MTDFEFKTFDELPAGYKVRTPYKLAASTLSRKVESNPSWVRGLVEIAVAGRWTEWGYGHSTSMIFTALERRGMIDVAESEKSGRRNLFRATRKGVLLANKWLEGRGEDPLPVPKRVDVPEGQDLKMRHDFASDPTLPTPPRILPEGDRPSEREWLLPEGARGEEWPENLGTWELHDAIRAEPDADRLRMLCAELQARLDGAGRVAVESG